MPLVTGGKQVASLYADIGAKTDNFTKGAANVKSGLAGMVVSIGAITSALKIMSDAWDLSKEGAQMQRLADSGGEMARQLGGDMDLIISKVKEASLGTVSEMDIIASSNKAMMLGLGADAEQLANLMEVAAFRGRAMGVSTTQAFDDIVRGIGRQSPMILDNLGIVINAKETYQQYAEGLGKTAAELTKAEKTQALLNRVLQEGNGMLQEAGGLVEDNAAQYEKLTARMDDYKASLARTLSDGIAPSVEAFLDYADAMDTASEATGLTDQRSRVYLGALQLQVDKENEAIEASQRGADSRWAALASYYDTTTAINGVTEAIEMDEEAIKELTSVNQEYLSLVGNLSESNQQLAEDQEEINQKYAEGKLTLEERNLALEDLATKQEEASQRMILAMLQEQMAADGLSTAEMNYLLTLGNQWGIYSDSAVAAADAALQKVQELNAAFDSLPSERTFTMSVLVQGAENVGGLGAGFGASQWEGRAAGGSVSAGNTYMVGERGPELFTPQSSGSIVPNNKLGGLDTEKIVSAVYDARIDESKLARAISEELLKGRR